MKTRALDRLRRRRGRRWPGWATLRHWPNSPPRRAPAPSTNPTPTAASRCAGLTKHYETAVGVRRVLDDISFTRGRKARKLAVLGRNGSGKSTLVKLLAGVEQPSPRVGGAQSFHVVAAGVFGRRRRRHDGGGLRPFYRASLWARRGRRGQASSMISPNWGARSASPSTSIRRACGCA